MPAKLVGHLNAKLVDPLTAYLVDRLTAKLVDRLTAKLVVKWSSEKACYRHDSTNGSVNIDLIRIAGPSAKCLDEVIW